MSNSVSTLDPALSGRLETYREVAINGLRAAFDDVRVEFSQTVRRVDAGHLRREGANLRYTAIAAFGLSTLSEAEQSRVLAGHGLRELLRKAADDATVETDLGAVALVAWAAAELEKRVDQVLVERLYVWLTSGNPAPTVSVAWALTAAVASLAVEPDHRESLAVARIARSTLLAHASTAIFPHVLPAESQHFPRAHVGSFADQVYPIQALARLAGFRGDEEALSAAERCATRICELQGAAGQWWWHYDARTGAVVERYPVYSVHQHAMAPMVLFDLARAGGSDHSEAVARGVQWLTTHPETSTELVSGSDGLIWRKVGRREPAKAARKLAAATTAIRPGWHLPGIDRLFPANRVDYECRPYELGWLLYAWRSDSSVPTESEEAR
jgi:hypothetical protein